MISLCNITTAARLSHIFQYGPNIIMASNATNSLRFIKYYSQTKLHFTENWQCFPLNEHNNYNQIINPFHLKVHHHKPTKPTSYNKLHIANIPQPPFDATSTNEQKKSSSSTSSCARTPFYISIKWLMDWSLKNGKNNR